MSESIYVERLRALGARLTEAQATRTLIGGRMATSNSPDAPHFERGCTLGHACDLAGVEWDWVYATLGWSGIPRSQSPSGVVSAYYGLTDEEVTILMTLNDTFSRGLLKPVSASGLDVLLGVIDEHIKAAT